MDARTDALHVDRLGDGPPLVLLHGWAMHAGLFAPVLPDLARRRGVHAVDLPGHGFSAPLADWTIDAVVGALDDAFAGAGPVDVLGWSLGGLVALAWARARPQAVRRLVLVSATPRFVASDDWPHGMPRETLRRFADELRVAYEPTLRRFLTLQVQGSDEGRATLAALRERLFERGTPDAAVLSGALEALGAADVRPDVPAIDQPALLVAGERDTLAPREASAWLAAALPRAELVVIPGAAHAPFLSHRERFLAAVQPFLA